MKKISANRGRYEILVDDEDYDDIKEASQRYSWCVVGHHNSHRVRCGPQRGPFLYLHRFLMCPKDDEFVRYLDGNRLNNQKENLLIVTPTQARQGVRKKPRGTSKYYGVQKSGRGFTAAISANRVCYHLGYYQTEIEAARAYDIKALEVHGRFARTNDISEDVIPKPCSRLYRKSGSSSIYRGVYRHNRNDGWAVMIRLNKKRIFLGVYDDEIHAARAYDIAYKKAKGPDATANDIPEDVIPVRRQHQGGRSKK